MVTFLFVVLYQEIIVVIALYLDLLNKSLVLCNLFCILRRSKLKQHGKNKFKY